MDNLINVSDLNQYFYCPRRYWYLKYFNTQGNNYYREDGKIKHKNKSKRGKWFNEMYLESSDLGLKGKIDVLEKENNEIKPIERKRGQDYYFNDELQLAGYCLLLEDNIGEKICEGIIYLYGVDQRIYINITDKHRNKICQVISEMKNLTVEEVPSFAKNLNKCKKCSTREYCMPEESKKLGEN